MMLFDFYRNLYDCILFICDFIMLYEFYRICMIYMISIGTCTIVYDLYRNLCDVI